MPRWEVHLSAASMALVVVLTGAVLGFYQSGIYPWNSPSLIPFVTALIFGSMAFLLGSVLPDIDGRGRIKWTIGPILGSFVMLPPVVGRTLSGNIISGLEHLWTEGARLFLIFTLIGFLLALLPMKHRSPS